MRARRNYFVCYTHRVALANQRILNIDGGQIRLAVKDYRRGGRREIVTLSAQEFIRRFLYHILPKRFRKIRYGGFMVCTVRQEKLAQARRGLCVAEEPAHTFQEQPGVGAEVETMSHRCPKCLIGEMKSVALPRWVAARRWCAANNSS